MARRRLCRDDAAAIQIVEAVLVAVLILTGIIFMSLVTRPPVPRSASGTDMGTLADDTLHVLEVTTIQDPDDVNRQMALDDWVGDLMAGTQPHAANVADAVEARLDEILPVGVKGAVRVNNGHGTILLVPHLNGGTIVPRGASVAQGVAVLEWTAFEGETPTDTLRPGRAFDWSSWDCLAAPGGETTGPQGQTWEALWLDFDATGQTVPGFAPYGIWRHDAGCDDAGYGYFEVVPASGTTDRLTTVGVEVVVWRGA